MLTESELSDVLQRVPELQAGLAEYFDEVLRIAARILEAERRDPPPPLPWAGLPDRDRATAFDARYPRVSTLDEALQDEAFVQALVDDGILVGPATRPTDEPSCAELQGTVVAEYAEARERRES